jgi:phosphoribosyl 1,2-cyclic phosphodiesterase
MISRRPFRIGSLEIEAFDLVHSHVAPAVGLRISAGSKTVFYAPDLVDIEDKRAALMSIDVYIGDGSFLTAPHVRSKAGVAFGHTSVREQLAWCKKAGIRRAIFTHCGSQIVRAGKDLDASLQRLAVSNGVEARLAVDGMKVAL